MASSIPSSDLAGYGAPEDVEEAHVPAGYGAPETIEAARVDVGPDARHERSIFGRPKMPEPKTDEELGIDEGPRFSREFPQLQRGGKTVFGLGGTIVPDAKSAPGTHAYLGAHSGDEMNDPGAQLITGAALAAPASALVAASAPTALSPLLSGGVNGAQQAAFQGQDPVTGFALGAIPGVGRAGAAARDAAEAAAFTRATSPGFGSGPGPLARAAGKLTGMAVGGASHGPLGLLVGHDLGGRAANLFSKAGDAATSALARRYVSRELGAIAPRAPMVDLGAARNTAQLDFHAPRATGFAADAPAIPNRISLAPLVSEGPILPTEPPPGFGLPARAPIGANEFDAFTEAGPPAGNHATVGGATSVKPRGRLQIVDENGNDLVSRKSSLLDDVKRDTKRFREGDYDDLSPGGPEPEPVESQLARSVRMLGELKSAARAGKASPTMIQDALKAGMSPQAVAKTVGREAFERATAQ